MNTKNIEPINTQIHPIDPAQAIDDLETDNQQFEQSLTEGGLSDNPDAIDGMVGFGSVDDDDENENENDEADDEPKNKMRSKLERADVDDLVKRCSLGLRRISEFELERGETNAEIKLIRESLEAVGIPKKSLAFALAVSKMTEDQMDGFYLALHYLLKSIDRGPKQGDLFLGQLSQPAPAVKVVA